MKQKRQIPKGKAERKAVAVPEDPNAQRQLKRGLGIIIAVFAFILYAQSISFNYTLDDNTVVKENSLTTKGLKGIPAILKTDYWYGVGIRVPQYRPASLVMYATEWQFFPDNPHVYHLVSVLLYAITCRMLFLLLCKLFGKQSHTYGIIFAFVCTLLYTAHPLHTEVVDNIKSGDEILCFLFAILSVYLFVIYTEKKSILSLVTASVCYFISILSKETGLAYLFLIPIMLFVFTKADNKKIVITVSSLVACTGLYFLIRAIVIANIPSISFDTPLENSLAAAPDFISQKATVFYVLLRYILLLIFPNSLTYDYSYAQIPIQKIGNPAVILSLITYFIIGIYAILKIRRKDYVAFAILFFLLTLFPVSNILVLTGSPMSERFMYMPSLGFCMLLTFLLIKLTKTESKKSELTTFKKLLFTNSSAFIIVFIIIGIYSFKTFARNPAWKDNDVLFGRDVEVSDKSAKAHYRWGIALMNDFYPKAASKEQADSILNKTAAEFLKAVSIANNYVEAHSNLSLIYEKAEQYDKALAYADSAIKYSPDNIGTYANKGFIFSQMGRFAEAIVEFEKCIKLNPSFDLAYKNMGICYANLKQEDKAIEYLTKARTLDPNDAKNLSILANAYQSVGDTLKARQCLEEANKLNAQH